MTRRYKKRKGQRKTQTWEEGTHIVSEYRWETHPLVNGQKKRKKRRKATVGTGGRFL